MDPITTAVLAVLPSLASDLVTSSVKDAYNGLKAVILRKWGEKSDVTDALSKLEANPKSQDQAIILSEKFAAANATHDKEVMDALSKLVDELKKANIGGEAVNRIRIDIKGGTQGVVGAQNVSIGTMNLGSSPQNEK